MLAEPGGYVVGVDPVATARARDRRRAYRRGDRANDDGRQRSGYADTVGSQIGTRAAIDSGDRGHWPLRRRTCPALAAAGRTGA